MPLPQTLTLSEAAADIRRTCGRHNRPFFFMVGAGVSSPAVPLASAIVEDCRKQRAGLVPPDGQSPMAAYMWWFEKAYPSRADRQEYMRRLIQDKNISHANLRLAHLLLDKRIANVVVTINFDDFLSRALALFGVLYTVCDHPHTVLRVNPERDDLQVVHVHGSYWFYDCCNLDSEVKARASKMPDRPFAMGDFLDRLLLNRSPLVVGYSGWEGDVFMSALERRLRRELEINLYWFCYQAANIDALPTFLKDHSDVRFVIPDESPKTLEVSSSGGREPLLAMRITAESESQRGPVLPAAKVFDELIRQFNLDPPRLNRDPLGWLADHLEASLPLPEEGLAGPDLYSIAETIEKVRRAIRVVKTVEPSGVDLSRAVLEPVRDAMRRAQYREAVLATQKIALADLDVGQLREVLGVMTDAARGLLDNSSEERAAYDLTIAAGDRLLEQGGFDAESRAKIARALVRKGVTLGQLNRSEEAIAVFDEVARRFGEAAEPALRAVVAGALINKGVTLRH